MPAVEVKGAGMPPLTLIFDPATALIVRQRYRRQPRRAAPGRDRRGSSRTSATSAASRSPFTAVVRVDGAVTRQAHRATVEYNVPLDPALFTRQG